LSTEFFLVNCFPVIDIFLKYNILTHPAGVPTSMMMRRDGEFKMMEMNLMMPSGMRMMTDGTIIKPDGTKMKMGEGQMMEIE
jgi:hypothetical protein